MQSIKKYSLAGIFFALLFTVSTAHASLLIEPHLAYNIHASGDATLGGVNHDYDYNGAQYGMRVGYQQLGFMGGLDYTRSSFDLDDETAAGTSSVNYDRNEWGVFVGYDFPILVRAWGAYYWSNKSERDNGNQLKGNTKELGVGMTALPFLSLNLMYRMVTYDEQKVGSTTSNLSEDINISEFVVGVSLPLNL